MEKNDDVGTAVSAGGEPLIVEVAFALPESQKIVVLTVSPGTTARQVVAMAQMPQYFPALPLETFTQGALGIFGKLLRDPDQHVLRAGDRVEIYRPLHIDPKQARAKRATRNARG
nr:RnfH family protein [uncultured Halomonas sp.]